MKNTRQIACLGAILTALVLLPACGGDDDGGSGPPPIQMVVPRDTDAGAAQRPQVTLTVSNGDAVSGTIVITLVPEYAPQTVANFLNYVNSGFYVNTIFHRMDSSFVLQAGGYTAPVAATDVPNHKATNPPIPLEIKVSNVQGVVSMARTSVLNSATSEFFINLANNDFLDLQNGGYAGFGYITDMTLVTTMTQAPCVPAVVAQGSNASCLPVPNLVITAAAQTR